MPTPQKNTAELVKVAITPQALGGRIAEVRGQRVLLDSDLADLYEVDTKRLNEQVTKLDRPAPSKRDIGFTANWRDDEAPKTSTPGKKQHQQASTP